MLLRGTRVGLVTTLGAASLMAIALVAFACSSDPAPATDAGADSSIDPTDTGSIDSGAPIDSGADTGVLVTYCDVLDPKPTFCDSFDRSTTLAAGWKALENHGTIAIVPDDAAPSSPNVALAGSLQCDAGNSCIGGLERALGPAKDIDVTMQVRLDAWDGKSNIDVASLGFDINKPSGSGTIYLDVEDGLFVIASTVLDSTGTSFDGSQREKTGVKANVGTWYRVGIRTNLSAAPPTATFTIGSTPATLTLPAVYTQASAPNATLHAGITFVTGPSEPAALRFDNVVVIVK